MRLTVEESEGALPVKDTVVGGVLRCASGTRVGDGEGAEG